MDAIKKTDKCKQNPLNKGQSPNRERILTIKG